jgi:hypothetical protein
MKKALLYLMGAIGIGLVVIYGFVFWGLASANPLLRWTIFVEPMIMSGALVFVGIIVTIIGVWLLAKEKKREIAEKEKHF